MTPESATRVLMVDDDENDAMLVRHMVGKMPDSGCQFHWAGSYEQGLTLLGEIDWDLCLVDYQLGARTGVEMIMESRARGVDCPFLLLTGAGSRAVDMQAMRAGVVGYLEKSRLCPLDLERAIRYAIGQSPKAYRRAAEELELERAIRYAIGIRQADQQPAGPASSHVPPEAVEFLTASYASGLPFVVISLALDREAVLRNHLGARHVECVNAGLEALVRARISSGDALFRAGEDALLLVSSSQEPCEGRQFLSLLLSEPLAVSGGDPDRTVSLPAIVRRNVFNSSGYLCPTALIADLEAFFAPGPRLRGPDFNNP